MPSIDSRWARPRTASQRVQRAMRGVGQSAASGAPARIAHRRPGSLRPDPFSLHPGERPRADALPGPWPAAIIRVAPRPARPRTATDGQLPTRASNALRALRAGAARAGRRRAGRRLGRGETLLGGAIDRAADDRIEARQQHQRGEGAGADRSPCAGTATRCSLMALPLAATRTGPRVLGGDDARRVRRATVPAAPARGLGGRRRRRRRATR